MRRSLKMWSAALFVILVIALSGCNGDNGGKHVNKAYTVLIQQMKFTPADLTVNEGDTVIWINKDIVEHNVTAASKDWASPNLPSGMSWNKVITKSTAYSCTLHPVMKGSLNVK